MAVGEINTASALMGLARKLEEDGANFYSKLAETYPDKCDSFMALAKENKRNIAQAEMTYYSVISDALEGCFSFKIFPAEYSLNLELKPKAKLSEALGLAVEMETQMVRFYNQSAEQSKSLLADLPRIFALIAEKRELRKTKLASWAVS
jgi:rubrerythrin